MSIDPNVLPPGTTVNQPEPPSEPRLFTIAHVERREAELRAQITELTVELAHTRAAFTESLQEVWDRNHPNTPHDMGTAMRALVDMKAGRTRPLADIIEEIKDRIASEETP
jgi:hypothetical protein